MKRILLSLFLINALSYCQAALKTWVGMDGDNWTNNNAWSPAGMPGTNDDVLFNTSGTVIFTASVSGVKSITVATGSTITFQSAAAYTFGNTVGAPLTVETGAVFQISGSVLSNSGIALTIDGTSHIDGTVNLLGGSNSALLLYSGIATTAKLFVTGTIKSGFLNIGGNNVDAGVLSGTTTSAGIQFQSGSVYEIARRGGLPGIPQATWAADAVLKISGCQSPSGIQLAWNGATPHELGTLIWDCASQGGPGTLSFASFPGVSKIKGDFKILNANNNIVRFSSSNSSSYTLRIQGDFISGAAVQPEVMSSTAASGGGMATLIFEKNVGLQAQLNLGNNTASTHALKFEGSFTGTGGSGAQECLLNLGNTGVYNLTINNNNNGVELLRNLDGIKTVNFLSGHIYLGDYNLTCSNTAGVFTGAGTNGWVVTNGAGTLSQGTDAAGRVFPVGVSSSSYDPVKLTPCAGSVKVTSSFSVPVADINKVWNREWEIVSNNTSTFFELKPDAVNATPPQQTGVNVIGFAPTSGSSWTEYVCGYPGAGLSGYTGTFATPSARFAVGIEGGFEPFTGTSYVFTGNGNWSDAANWLNNQLPPNPLPAGDHVIINPSAGGQCQLDIAYTLQPGSRIILRESKNLVINGNLTIQ